MGNEFLVKSKGNIFNLKSQENNNFKLNPEKGNSFNVDSSDTVNNSSDIANKPSYAVDTQQTQPIRTCVVFIWETGLGCRQVFIEGSTRVPIGETDLL